MRQIVYYSQTSLIRPLQWGSNRGVSRISIWGLSSGGGRAEVGWPRSGNAMDILTKIQWHIDYNILKLHDWFFKFNLYQCKFCWVGMACCSHLGYTPGYSEGQHIKYLGVVNLPTVKPIYSRRDGFFRKYGIFSPPWK